MEQKGFIHSMMDVKVLILYVTARSLYPLTEQKIYELCYQDDCLSYFDVCEAIPQMVETGHLEKNEKENTYVITEKGREAAGLVEDSLAYPVAQRARQAVEKNNREVKRGSMVRTEIVRRPDDDYSVIMGLDDPKGSLMTLELMAPTARQARRLTAVFEKNAEAISQTLLELFLEETEGNSEK